MSPDQYTLEQKMIDVGDGHRLTSCLWGSKDAEQTIVFLHGGPGSGCSDNSKSYFDASKHRVIFFDQRGSGQSLPYGSLKENNTDKLIEDISKVTKSYGVDKFIILGGSWGSLLGLAYAIKYPDKVIRLIIRGVFTGRSSEDEHLYKGQFKSFFPDVWEEYLKATPAANRQDPSTYHMQKTLGSNAQKAKKSAYALSKMEGSIASLDDRLGPDNYETFDPIGSIIETHFLANNCFIEDGYIIANAKKLTMPVDIVQGRYDMICPPITAYELNKQLPNSRLYFTTAGHSGSDRANWDLLRSLLT